MGKCVPIFHRTSSDSDKITMEEDYDIAETNDDINVTLSDNFENENITKHVFHEYHDYSYDDMPTKIHHLMYSDTLIVVISLIIMIIVGLVFRTCCLKLTSCNQRKERVRGGLRQLADHMHHVTRSMANDLELQQHQHNNSLLVLAINNSIGINSSKETEAGVEMASLPTT